jgi:hypothetical protein
MEGRMSASHPIDIGVYARLTGVLARLLELVGIRRLTKPLDPTSELAKALEAYPVTAIDGRLNAEPRKACHSRAEIVGMRTYKVRPPSSPCRPRVAKVHEHTLSFRHTARIVVDAACSKRTLSQRRNFSAHFVSILYTVPHRCPSIAQAMTRQSCRNFRLFF